MGLRGPKKTPEAVKIANGTFRRDRDSALAMPAADHTPPGWLSEGSRAVWANVVKDLSAVDGLLCTVDSFALARYCDDWVEYWAAVALVEEEGMVAFSEKGGAYQHPAVGIKNKAAERMARFEARFGMTPSDRCGLKTTPAKPQGVRSRARA